MLFNCCKFDKRIGQAFLAQEFSNVTIMIYSQY